MQMLFRLCKELDHYTLGTNYQSFAAFVFQDYPKYLQLGYGLLHTKAGNIARQPPDIAQRTVSSREDKEKVSVPLPTPQILIDD